MIYFIKNESDGGIIYPNRRKSGTSALAVVKKLCVKHLTSFESYQKSVRHITKEQYKIPIVLSSKYAFFATKSYHHIDSIWINYMQIKEIIYMDKYIEFIFDETYRIKVSLSTKSYQRLVSLIFKVLNYKVSLE